MIIGCYTTGAGGEGTGLVVPGRATRATVSPSFVIVHDGVVFAANETAEGAVSSFALDAGLTPLSSAPTGGSSPCHLAYHPAGYVLAANYMSGSVSVHPVTGGVLGERTDLAVHSGQGPVADRQEGPHAHQVVVHPDGAVTVVDLGIDRLVHYRLDGGKLERTGETALPPGTGPRHMVVHPSGAWFVVSELSAKVLRIVDGEVTESADTSSGKAQPSAIVLDGDLLYVANRGVDTLAVFEVAPALRRVTEKACGGTWPRDLALDGDRIHVANERSHAVVTFTTGRDPQPTGEVFETPSPTCVAL